MKSIQMLRRHIALPQSFAIALLACGPVAGGPAVCAPGQVVGLPAEIRESSGVAASQRNPGVIWTHNDSGDEPVLYALDANGRLLGQPQVEGARNVDWEDIAVGRCPAGSCVYIADTGDNEEDRENAAVYRVAEPDPASTGTAPADRFPIRFPNGARDVEAIFVTAAGDVYLISKGRHSASALYRFKPGRAGEAVTVEQVQLFGDAPFVLPSDLVTGADALPDGTVAIRSYATLRFYTLTETGLIPAAREPVNLTELGEAQGEGVAFADATTIVLTSEGKDDTRASMTRLQCDS